MREPSLTGAQSMPTAIRTVLLMVLLALGSPAIAQDVYTNPVFGFSARKPSSWHYFTVEQQQENLKGLDFNDPKFKELLTKHARVPFFAITKFKEPHPDLNPSVRVNVREAGNLKGVPPEKAMQAITAAFPRIFKDFSVAEGPVATKVLGHAAAYVRVNYTLEAAGSSWRTTSEMWLVPRGDVIFVIGAGTREDQKNATLKEIRSIVDTIKIE
jgi:hypothetical protein